VRVIRLNETGRRIGESHPNTKLTDHDVELILALVDEGLSYTEVAEKFEVSKSCIQHIVSGRNRGQWAARMIRVSVSMDRGD
jgi:transposase